MSKIDTSNWGKFRIGDLFECEYGKFIPKTYEDGNTRLITTSGVNNGISAFVNIPPTHNGNCITVASDGSIGASFFQDKPFITNNIVSTLTPHENVPLTQNIALFICTVIQNYAKIYYGWDNKFSVNRVRDSIIPLPSKTISEPDWDYMENYMKSIEAKVSASIEKLTAASEKEKKKIDVSGWGEFRIGDLFTQERGKESSPNRVADGNLPMVNEINTNNGIAKMGSSNNIIKGNCLTVSVNYATNVFYQNSDFCASVNILVLRNPKVTEYSGKFIASVLSIQNKKYDYTNKISKDRLNNETIKLPVTSTGEPDWAYMEEYMKQKEQEMLKKIEALKV